MKSKKKVKIGECIFRAYTFHAKSLSEREAAISLCFPACRQVGGFFRPGEKQ